MSNIEQISAYYDDDSAREAIVMFDRRTVSYHINFFEDLNYIKTEYFPGKSIHYVEDAAENYVKGIKKVNEYDY